MEDIPIQNREDEVQQITDDAIHRTLTPPIDATSHPRNEAIPEEDLLHPIYPNTFDNLLEDTQDTPDILNFDLPQLSPDITTFTNDPMKHHPALSSWRGYKDPMESLFARMDDEFERELKREIHHDLPDFMRPEPLPSLEEEAFEQGFLDAREDPTSPHLNMGEHKQSQQQTAPRKGTARKRKASPQDDPNPSEKQKHAKKDSGVWFDLLGSDEDVPPDDTFHDDGSTSYNIPVPHARRYFTHILDDGSEERGITLAEVNTAGTKAGLPPMDFSGYLDGV